MDAASGLTTFPQKAQDRRSSAHGPERSNGGDTPHCHLKFDTYKIRIPATLWYLLNLMHYSTLGDGLVQFIRSHHYPDPQVGQEDDTQCQQQSSNPCVGKHKHTHSRMHIHMHTYTLRHAHTHTCTHTHCSEGEWLRKIPSIDLWPPHAHRYRSTVFIHVYAEKNPHN